MSNEYAKRTVKDVLKSLALLAVVCIAGYFLLRPSASELAGGWNPPTIFSNENAFAKYDESNTTLAEDRATGRGRREPGAGGCVCKIGEAGGEDTDAG